MNEAACWSRLAAMLAIVRAGCDSAGVDESIASIQSTTFRDGESYCWDADGNDSACPETMPT